MFIPININELKNILNNNKLLKNTVGKISSICTTGQQIVLNARRIGLNVTSSYDTPGDGNCFYRAVIEQLKDRNDLGDVSLLLSQYPNHQVLRFEVVDFVRFLSVYQNIPYVNNYKFLYEQNILQIPGTSHLNWEGFLDQQSHNSIYATELFIKATAVLLDIDIFVTSENCNENQPFNRISRFWNNDDPNIYQENQNNKYILLGNLNSDHFQSLIPVNECLYINHDFQITSNTENAKRSFCDDPSKSFKYQRIGKENCIPTSQSIHQNSNSHIEHIKETKDNKDKDKVDSKDKSKGLLFENELKLKCQKYDVIYEEPLNNETKIQMRNRRRKMNYAIKKKKANQKSSVDAEPIKDKVENNDKFKCSLIENDLKLKCLNYNVVYEEPSNNETKIKMRNRRRKMKYDIEKEKAMKITNSHQKSIENDLKLKCQKYDVIYEEPPNNETQNQQKSRRRKINYEIQKKKARQDKLNRQEIDLEIKCINSNVNYKAPTTVESIAERKNRRKSLNRAIQKNLKKSLNDNDHSSSNSDEVSSHHYPSNTSFIHSNPRVVEAMKIFEKAELKHEIGKCNVCFEVQPIFYKAQSVKPTNDDSNIFTKSWSTLENGMCERCNKENLINKKKKSNTAPRFSGIYTQLNGQMNNTELNHNNMHFFEIPPFLKNLTTLETAMISKINIIMNVTVLKYGMLSGKGHSIGIPNNMKIAKTLPTLPQDVGIIILRKKGDKGTVIRDYTVKRKRIEEALKGLVYGVPYGGVVTPLQNYKLYEGPDHLRVPLKGRYFEWLPNPYYYDVTIDNERINKLPTNDSEQCPGLNQLEFENEIPNLNKNISEGQPGSTDISSTYSGIVTPLQPNDVSKQLNQILQKIIGDEDTVENVLRLQNVGVADLERNRGEPIPEMKTPGFFAQAYPTIFINGSADITIPQLVKLDYQEWVTHIYYNCDNRVSSHPFLKFFLLNLGLRMRALQQGSFIVAQQLNDAHLTIEELRNNLENDDESVPRKLISVGAKFANSDPYWRDRKIELDNLVLFRKKEFGDLPAYFDTNSLAEFQWKPLKELFIKYISKIEGTSPDIVRAKVESDFLYYQKVILSNLHIVGTYFNNRTVNYYTTVGKELFQTSDMWIRYEFAKGRGEIHSHAIISSSTHSEKIKEAMDLVEIDKQTGKSNTEQAAIKLHKWLQTDSENTEDLFSPNFVSMHPAGGRISTNEKGENAWIPHTDLWPKPTGNYQPPSYNPLSENLSNHSHDQKSLNDFHIALTNKVGIHKCNSTCLKYKKKNSKFKYCRFHFGKTNTETKESEGKSIHPFHPLITDGDHPRFEGNRDHSHMISHIKTRLLSWLANSDSQAIIDQDLMSLLKYITQYACKGSSSTDDLVRLYKHLLDVNSNNTSVKSIAQQLLLKIIGLIDMPAAAVDYLNCGGQLYHCTRKFRRISLSGFRMLCLNSKDGKATKESPLDQFLGPKRREKYPEMCLYDWATLCICARNCGEKHVPVFTGLPVFPVWPLSEEYCQGQLMIYSPGTWKKVEDLKKEHTTYIDAFSEFVTSDFCPRIVCDLIEKSKIKYDKKVLKNKKKVVPDLLQEEDQMSDTYSDSSLESDDEIDNLREIRDRLSLENKILNDLSTEQHQQLDQLHEIRPLPDGGREFDWHEYAKNCFGGVWPTNASAWLTSISDAAENNESAQNQNCSLPIIDLTKANSLQRVIISINILNLLSVAREQPRNHIRLLIQGTAGSGKTFTIMALTYLARRIRNRNDAVMNLAPTGAASILLPNGRTVHSTTSIPRKTKNTSSKTVQLNDKPLNNKSLMKLRKLTGSLLESNSVTVNVLNLDERGMFSPEMLAWCSHRFKEATTDFVNSFGAIPTVNFFGDLGQLGPVQSKDLHVEPLSTDSPVKLAGFGIYRSFSECIVLNQTMRQGPDEIDFLNMLLRIRSGEITQSDWKVINSRCESELSESEKKDFQSDTCLTVMETWNEVNLENHNKLEKLGVPVATIPSKGRGRHHSQIDKQVGQIPSTAYIAVGSRVMLTKNQFSLTPLGLNNGAIGKVISILYPPNCGPPSFPEAVVVDFPRYKGPHWIPEYPTWVPIPVNESRCEKNCCVRTGLPLIPGYSIPISKSQGITVGPNQPCTHIRIKLNREIFMEKLNLGITYTALSRACKLSYIALVEKIPFDRLAYINNHPWMAKRKAEEERLKTLSDITLQKYGKYSDINEYKLLLREFDNFVNDGIKCHEE